MMVLKAVAQTADTLTLGCCWLQGAATAAQAAAQLAVQQAQDLYAATLQQQSAVQSLLQLPAAQGFSDTSDSSRVQVCFLQLL
jgi:hypothetical protein